MIFTVIIALLFLSSASEPDSTEQSNFNVGQALEIAYSCNPAIRQLESEIEAQRQTQSLNLGIKSPELMYAREGIGGGTFTEQRWVVSQSLDFPLTGYYRLQGSKAGVSSLQSELHSLKLQVKEEVKKAYTRLAHAIKSRYLAQERVDLFRNMRNAARARSDLGEASEIDAMQAELQLSEAENNLESTQRVLMNERYNLFEIIGLDEQEQPYDISFPDTLHYVDVLIDQEAVLESIRAHPQLSRFNALKTAASFNTKAARSGYLPDINITYFRQDFGGGFEFNGFELGVTVPLWFGINETNEVRRAEAKERAMEWRFIEEELSIKKQAEQAWHGYAAARARIERFQASIQERSRDLVGMTQRGYRLGELDLLTLLEAQRTYLRTQQSYYDTLRDYYLSVIELERFLQTDIIFNQQI